MTETPIIIALPKGRILRELEPLFSMVDLTPEASFYDEHSRALMFETNHPGVRLIRVRSFDVPTFVAYGAAQLGIAGSDVLEEQEYPGLYAPLDLQIGQCRMSVAALKEQAGDKAFLQASHVRVATKYPNITAKHFATHGMQAECIKLNGAMELAPSLGLCDRIVDLVSTGATLKANGLVETEEIMQVSSRLIVHRGAFKTREGEVQHWVSAFQEAVNGKNH